MFNDNGKPGGYFGTTENPRKGGGLFGGGGRTRDIIGMILGTIGDGLAIRNGQRPMIAPMLMQRQYDLQQQARADQERNAAEKQQILQRQAQADAGRALGMSDAQIQAQQTGLDVPNPYRWRANNGDLMEMGPNGQARAVYSDPTPRINWIQVRDPATGAISIVPMGPNGPMNGGQQAPDTLPPDFNGWDADPQPISANNGPPVPETTGEGLGAMISVHGVDRVQRWMQSGQLRVRN